MIRLVAFLHGAVASGCIVAAWLFSRSWRQSRDRLLLHFSLAFSLLALSYVMLGTISLATDWRVYVFVLRLLAFCVILYGVFEKNRR